MRPMNSFLIIAVMALNGVGYPPPSEREILWVFQREFRLGPDQFVDPVNLTEDHSLHFSDYPVDVILKHCDPLRVRGEELSRKPLYDRGYRCLFEVISYALLPYDVQGVLSFNGMRWEFHGIDYPSVFRPQMLLNRPNSVVTPRSLKPGAIDSRRAPDPYRNRQRPSPYRDVLTLP